MGLLLKALKGKSSETLSSSGLLQKALSLTRDSGADRESTVHEKRSGTKKGDAREDEERFPPFGDISVAKRITGEAYSFVRDSLDKGHTLLLVKIALDITGNDSSAYDQIFSALRTFLAERSIVYKSGQNNITIIIALKTIDEEIFLHQLKNHIDLRIGTGFNEYSLSVRYITDISMV